MPDFNSEPDPGGMFLRPQYGVPQQGGGKGYGGNDGKSGGQVPSYAPLLAMAAQSGKSGGQPPAYMGGGPQPTFRGGNPYFQPRGTPPWMQPQQQNPGTYGQFGLPAYATAPIAHPYVPPPPPPPAAPQESPYGVGMPNYFPPDGGMLAG
jgi:hypothetical protein